MRNTFKAKVLKSSKYVALMSTVFSSGVAAAQSNNFTTAGTSVANTFALNYSVSGTSQPEINNTSNPTTFTVDRLVDLTVDYQANSDDANVAPGAITEELVFMLRNDGNDNFAYTLNTINEANAANQFDTATLLVRYYIDDGDGVYQPGAADGSPTDFSAATPDLAPDRVLWIEVRGNIPVGQKNNDVSNVSLVADTLYPTAWIEESAPASPGTAIGADDGTNDKDSSADNVLADGSGTSNENANEGDHSDTGTFTISSPDLLASKTVSVISTNLDGSFACASGSVVSANEYAVAGACVEYTISVVNSGSTSADAMTVTDTLPDELTFVEATFTNFTGGTPTKPAASTNCASGACIVSQAGTTVASGQTAEIVIRALIK